MTRWLAVLVLVAAGALLGVSALRTAARPPEPRELIEPMRDELRTLRAAADSCQAALERQESGFLRYDQRVDALRERVRSYESLHPEGVPADSYAIYLEAFERYNASVPVWRERADTLEARWERCRRLTEAHNTKTDAFRELLLEAGVWMGPSPDPPPPPPAVTPSPSPGIAPRPRRHGRRRPPP